MKEPRAESKIQVIVIDKSGLETQALTEVLAKLPNAGIVAMSSIGDEGYIETPNGIYFLSEEGVGSDRPISEENPVEVTFQKRYDRNGEISMEMLPSYGYRMSVDELKALPVKKTVTLDKFIRHFGARLEANYEQWQMAMSKAMRAK